VYILDVFSTTMLEASCLCHIYVPGMTLSSFVCVCVCVCVCETEVWTRDLCLLGRCSYCLGHSDSFLYKHMYCHYIDEQCYLKFYADFTEKRKGSDLTCLDPTC
jgi:hypothetical protein